MRSLSKYDVFFYLSQMEAPTKEELIKFLRRNAFFEHVSERTVSKKLNELKKEKLLKGIQINTENPKTYDCLAFLCWARMKGKEYNRLLDKKSALLFKTLFENGPLNFKEIVKKTGLSKPTLIKYIGTFTENGVFSVIKKKPLVLKANLNDLTLFYANFLDLSFELFEKQFGKADIPKISSKKLISATIKLHVHSTTVTEGNTATEDDVERVFGDYPVKLTPREVTEILNARSAINEVFSICKKDINIEEIKHLHRILMNNLLEKPGEFYYGRKRLAGFETKLPSSKQEIDFSMAALLNFAGKPINPVIISPMVHFIFASVHPFADGNGRVARLMHSWILLKAGLPLFVFDPKKRNEYFALLEKSRNESIEDFINFCIKEHRNSLEELMKKEA
ncbi:Fic/DOC family protein [uncultured archaeon]|nr:Fic/DOC family protein [uncultured archaeon]